MVFDSIDNVLARGKLYVSVPQAFEIFTLGFEE